MTELAASIKPACWIWVGRRYRFMSQIEDPTRTSMTANVRLWRFGISATRGDSIELADFMTQRQRDAGPYRPISLGQAS